MRKIAWMITLMMLVSLAMPAVGFAAGLPSAFWSLNDAYAAAKDSGDDQGIITHGEAIIELLTGQEATDQIKEILASKFYDVADAYDRQGNFPKAGYYYERYIPYGTFMNWTDGVKIAKAKSGQYQPTVQAYTTAVQPQKQYGARNEHALGVLFGQVSEHSRAEESMVLLYIDYGNMLSDWDRFVLNQARERNQGVEIAWNIQGQGSALWDIPNQGAYVNSFLEELNAYKDIPMFLRIGAEMNIWNDKPDPGAYQRAFQFLADKVHSQTSHVATVWSVAHASGWDTHMEDFYPGDAYVDWVGISAYMIRHFQGRTWPVTERFNEVCFLAGDAADPVKVVEEAIQKFGDRKPIMLAECGVAHTTISMGESHTDWAVNHLNRLYWFVPMVYPQVKLMAYFNTYVFPETNNYALNDSPTLKAAYEQVTKAPHMIQNPESKQALYTYQPVSEGMFFAQKNTKLYAYPHVYGDDNPTVRYTIDGAAIAETSQVPYELDYNFASCGIGEHTLGVETISGGQVVASAKYTIYVTENITVEVNGKELISDTAPLMENDRVLVPMRTIFEELGATVSWRNETQTAIGTKNGVTVEISIDQKELKRNGQVIVLDTPARMINGRTMVPVRAVSEALNAEVDWIGSENKVTVVTR